MAHAASITGGPCASTARTRLEAARNSPALARRFVRDVLAGHGADGEPLERAVLLVSELVTNAVVHAGTAAWLSVSAGDGTARIEVEDQGGGQVARRQPGDLQPTGAGFGLWLVDSLADSWGVDHGQAKTKRVWLSLTIPGAAPCRHRLAS